MTVEEGESFVSYDVVSLFTKTPIKEACEIIRKRLQNDKTLKKRTNLNVNDIMELLKFVLETTVRYPPLLSTCTWRTWSRK